MKKTIAVITDIHGNLEGITAILNDIKNKNIDKIICLGDVINLGVNSKECLDLIINNNIDMVLGNHELYCIKGTDIDNKIGKEEKNHYDWVRESLTEEQKSFLKRQPLKYEYEISYDNKIPNKKIIFSHYLIEDINKDYPFETNYLKKDINLWIKYNNPNTTYVIGHLHKSFNINEINGISGDYIEAINELTNIEIVESAGCSYNDEISYMLIEIDKTIVFKNIKVKFDRNTLEEKLNETNFPDKNNILKYFYGIE